MKKFGALIAIGGVIVIILLFFGMFFLYANGVYNKAVSYQEEVNASWGDVLATYQRRADLIPNLMATVKGAGELEKEILTRVTEARAGIVNAKTPEDVEIMGRKINTAINLAFEAYPQIKSTQNYLEFQAQQEGTENRINVSRQKYNASVKNYNSHIRGYIRRIAINFLADSEEFPKKEQFKAAEGAEVAPKVEF